MPTYKTPDVYTEEISTLPPSVAEVSTAVPAFIGYTEKAVLDGKDVSGDAVRISTFLEFKEIFGGYDKTGFTVKLGSDESIEEVTATPPNSMLYYALDSISETAAGYATLFRLAAFPILTTSLHSWQVCKLE